jgi:NAD(P)-dependent dehydrogenase (short-subunit alcohol dehydrogenase family)
VTGLLEGRHVVVTGAGSGIGRATARFAAESGATIAAWDIVPDAARQTAKDTGGIDCTCDVTDPEQVEAAAARTFDAFGTVEGLVNAAGIFEIDGGVERGDLGRWNRTIATNLTSVFLISHAVVRRLPERPDAAIVNIASMAGLRGFPEEAAYDASKGGVVNLTRQMAVDLARRGIRVNAIAPGEVETPMMLVQQQAGESYEALRDRLGAGAPLGRVGQPEEIGQVATFLLSPLASYITGAIISVDGGQTAR